MDELNAEQQVFARDEDNELPLIDVVKKYKPTIMLGVTAVGGLFTEELIKEMASNVEKPIIFPLSNPTSKSECTAAQAYEWTDGNLIFASGSPFEPVEMSDGRSYTVSQCNNMYIFPGLGLGASLCGAKRVTDRMLYLGAKGTDCSIDFPNASDFSFSENLNHFCVLLISFFLVTCNHFRRSTRAMPITRGCSKRTGVPAHF